MKRVLCALTAAALLLLCGCSLALADSPEPGADVLVGAFVSRELLAQPGDREIEGQRSDDGWRFDGVEGVMVYILPETAGDGMVFVKSGDPRVEYGGVTVGGGMTYEAALTLEEGEKQAILHFNPLYRRSDGSMYAKAAVGISVSGDANTGGWRASETAAGAPAEWQTESWTSDVTIRYGQVSPPEEYILCRMDGDDRVLLRETYAPGTLPERLSPREGCGDCVWLLVECRRADGSVERTACGTDSGALVTQCSGENGFLRRVETELVWETEN